MRSAANVQTLSKGLEKNKSPKINHSDLDDRYIYKDYIKNLKIIILL